MSDEPHDKYKGKSDHEAAGWHPDYGHGIQFRPSNIEVKCLGCLEVITVPLIEKFHVVHCGLCQHEFRMEGGKVVE